MPYRTSARDRRDERERDIQEIEAVARADRARRRRAAVIVVATLVASWASVFLLLALGSGRHVPTMHCHNVSLTYENAPQVPPQTWTACEER
jgi:hypothetical protein